MNGLMKQYSRKEVAPSPQASPPPQATMDKWFSPGPTATNHTSLSAKQIEEAEFRSSWTHTLKGV